MGRGEEPGHERRAAAGGDPGASTSNVSSTGPTSGPQHSDVANPGLYFVQHIALHLKIGGRAAVVVPDNVPFEGGSGEILRRRLLKECDVHTLLRLPTGIFYAGGVKANVLFFDAKRARPDAPWTSKLWVYDFRTGKHFTLRQNKLQARHLDDFVIAYQAPNRHEVRDERFRPTGSRGDGVSLQTEARTCK